MLLDRHGHGDHIIHAFKTLVCGAHLVGSQTFNYVLRGWLHQHALDVHAHIFNHVFFWSSEKKVGGRNNRRACRARGAHRRATPAQFKYSQRGGACMTLRFGKNVLGMNTFSPTFCDTQTHSCGSPSNKNRSLPHHLKKSWIPMLSPATSVLSPSSSVLSPEICTRRPTVTECHHQDRSHLVATDPRLVARELAQ